jgi:hypothetical protein
MTKAYIPTGMVEGPVEFPHGGQAAPRLKDRYRNALPHDLFAERPHSKQTVYGHLVPLFPVDAAQRHCHDFCAARLQAVDYMCDPHDVTGDVRKLKQIL